ncbi:MAG: hypothetical protein PHY54_19565 [Methylococcales bacterium]|nr:hypothetical protein [Methylococcales bacterium]
MAQDGIYALQIIIDLVCPYRHTIDTADRQAWGNKISLMERFNDRTLAGTAANDKTWRIAV